MVSVQLGFGAVAVALKVALAYFAQGISDSLSRRFLVVLTL